MEQPRILDAQTGSRYLLCSALLLSKTPTDPPQKPDGCPTPAQLSLSSQNRSAALNTQHAPLSLQHGDSSLSAQGKVPVPAHQLVRSRRAPANHSACCTGDLAHDDTLKKRISASFAVLLRFGRGGSIALPIRAARVILLCITVAEKQEE